MARIRTIKPDFWTDEKVVELSPLARLLFIGLWNFCDDDGRMVYSPKRLKMQIFPNETDFSDVLHLTAELFKLHMVDIYTVDGVEYLQVMQFAKHQKIDKRTPSKLPPKPPTDSPPGAQAPAEAPPAAASTPETHSIPPTNQGDSTSSPDFPRIPPSSADGREGNGREEEENHRAANVTLNQPMELSTGQGEHCVAETQLKAANDGDAEAKRAEHVAGLPLATQLAIAARKCGVECQPFNPLIQALAGQGVTAETMTAACEHAKTKKPNQAVPLGYVVKVLEGWAAEAGAVHAQGAAAPAATLSIARKAELLGTQAGIGEQKFDYEQRVTREYAAFAANGFVKPDAPQPIPLAPNVAQLPKREEGKAEVSEANRRAALEAVRSRKAS